MNKKAMITSMNIGSALQYSTRSGCRIRRRIQIVSLLGALALALPLLAGCGVILHHYPEPNVGWHSKNYSIVFGVLTQHDTNPVSWTIRYSSVYAGDKYGGKFALTPNSALIGYVPGNTVEIHGHPEPKRLNKAGTGTLYHVTSIRLWLGKGRPNYLTR
jgi:hypothetical protein